MVVWFVFTAIAQPTLFLVGDMFPTQLKNGQQTLRNCFDFVTENYGFSSDIKCNFSCLWLLIISRTLSFVEAPWCVVAYDEDTGALPHQVSRLYGGYTTAD